MKWLLIFFLSSFLSLTMPAQNTLIWEGGTPGKETNWNEPNNWNLNRVPTEDDKVIIKMENKGHFAQPIIKDAVHIAWLEIHSGAKLSIQATGKLIIDGTYHYSEGISMYGGNLDSSGEIIFMGIKPAFIAQLAPLYQRKKIYFKSELYGYEVCVLSSLKEIK